MSSSVEAAVAQPVGRSFALFVIGAMVLGVFSGWIINTFATPQEANALAAALSLITDVFLRLVKMIIAPLVFSTLVVGIASMEDSAAIGRLGLKTMGWFMAASIVSLLIGLVMVNILQPGSGVQLALPGDLAAAKSAPLATADFSVRSFLSHVVPTSIIKAMSDNEILQIVVSGLFVGVAISALKEQTAGLLAVIEQVAIVMLRITHYVMMVAPLAVFAALAGVIATQGIVVLLSYAKFILGFYASLAILWCVLLGALILIIGRRALKLPGAVRHPILVAFSTSSSEAAYPLTLKALQAWGVPRKVANFVLPLGYSFNLDGSMMYCTFATMFVAQVYGVQLSIGQQLVMMALLMVTSKGIASVPRASLVVIAATLAFFNLPQAGILLILAVDHVLDMGRSATNVLGNSVASAVVAKWEGNLAAESRPRTMSENHSC